jgi:hypothetical protein
VSYSATPRVLTEKARLLLEASAAERIAHINSAKFIPHPAVNALLEEFEQLLVHPITNRMPNRLVVGRSNSGKTELLKEFLLRHPVEMRSEEDAMYVPVFFIPTPPGPDEDMFLTRALHTLGGRINVADKASVKLSMLLDRLSRVGTRMILLDELNALLAGSAGKQRYFLQLLRYISNESRISIIATGTDDARIALSTDAQMESRFPVRSIPRLIEPDTGFRQVLMSFESTFPLRHASNLAARATARLLFEYSNGVMGELAMILRSAAEAAIKSGAEQITDQIIHTCPHVVAAKSFDPSRL